MNRQTLPIPMPWLVMDGIAMAGLALGLFGKLVRPGGALSILSDPALHWSLIIAGGAGAVVAAVMIVQSLRNRH